MRRMLMILLILGIATTGFAQVLSTQWAYTVNNGNVPAWFKITDDDVRGIAAYDGKVFLGSFRSRGIKVIDIASGDSIDTVTESAITIGDVEVDEDGIIFGSSIVGHDGQWLPVKPVTIYMWDSVTSERDTLLEYLPDTTTATGSPYFRLGDKFSVEGSYTSGTLELYIVDSGWWGNRAFKFTMNGSVMNPVPEIITFSGTGFVKTDNQAIIAPLLNTDDFLLSGSGQKITYVTSDGVFGDQFSTGIAGDGNSFVAFEANSRKFVVQNLIWSAQSFQVLEWTDGIPGAWRHWGMTPTAFGPSGNNGNQTGDIEYIDNGDGTVDIFALMTDNGLAVYTLEIPITPEDPVNMTAEWQKDGGFIGWFPSSGDVVRGMGYNSGTDHVLIASRAGGVGIYAMDAATGVVVDTLDMTNVTDGFYGIALMKVIADENGVIYACNLASGGDFKIYRWENEAAAPTVALQQAVTSRFGDVLAIYGSGTDTKLYANANGGTVIKVFGTTDGINFAEEFEIPVAAGAANGGISVVGTNTLWINAPWKNATLIQNDGTILSELTTLDSYYGNVRQIVGPHGEKLLAMNTNHSEGNRRKVKVYDITEDVTNPIFWGTAEAGNFERGNANVTGDLQYKINADGSVSLFQMATNNTVACWNLSLPHYDNDLMITFEDDSDVANWGAHDEANQWTAFAYSAEDKALKMTDAGYGFLAKRPLYATKGTNFKLNINMKVSEWAAPYQLFVTVVGMGTDCDTVEVTNLTEFSPVIVNGVADTSESGYIKIWGMNTLLASEVLVNFVLFDDYAADAELAISDNVIDFGLTAFHGANTFNVTAYNNGSENLVFESSRFAIGDYFSASVADEVVAAGDSTIISVVFNPLIEDAVEDMLLLVTNGGVAGIKMMGSGYELWPMAWRLTAGDPNTEWFWTSSLQHYVRSLAYNPLNNHIYVVSRIGGPHIYVLNGETGAFLGELNNTGIDQNGATFHVNTIDVTDDGQIIVASLARTPDKFNLYHYANENAAPTMIYSDDVGIVAGDALSVAGTGTNLTVFSAGHWSSNDSEIDKVVALSTTDLTNWTKELIQLPAKQDANYGLSAVGNGDYLFVNGTGANPPMYLKKDGTVLHTFDPVAIPGGTSVNYFEVAIDGGVRRFVSLTNGWSSGTAVVELLGSPGDSLCSDVNLVGPSTENYYFNSNANATAMSVYNSYNNSIVELVTNNGISSYSLDVVATDAIPQTIPVLSVEPAILDFGTLLNETKSLEFTVENTGTADLVITGVEFSSAILTSTLSPVTLTPGQSETYTLDFHAEGLDGLIEETMKIISESGFGQLTASAECIMINGNVVDEDFADWTEFTGHRWDGTNVVLRTDGYGHNDANYIGSPDENLNQPIIILSPKIVNPKKLMFYFAEYSGSSDSWTMDVVLSEDGETWVDTLGTYTNPNTLDWQLAVHTIDRPGEFYIGFVVNGTVSGGMFLDDVKIDADGIAIDGTAINENFEGWSDWDVQWGGQNATMYNDQYSHSGSKYLGAESLNQVHKFITPRVVDPEYLSFFYAQYSTASDDWTVSVVLSTDGINWDDTVAVFQNPGNLDWQYASIELNKIGTFYIAWIIDGSITGGMFIDDVKIDGSDVVLGIGQERIPVKYNLSQNYPNPFNPTTNIKLALPIETHVDLKVYNIVGQEVLTLKNEVMNAGYHMITFDASELSSGIYFYRVHTDGFNSVKKMTILK